MSLAFDGTTSEWTIRKRHRLREKRRNPGLSLEHGRK